jgi:hypothetical protein
VGRADARSRQIRSPDAITFALQVSRYSGEPVVSSSSTNLFAKDRWRLALADEPKEAGPEMSFVLAAFLFARRGKGLTGT